MSAVFGKASVSSACHPLSLPATGGNYSIGLNLAKGGNGDITVKIIMVL